MDRLAIGREWSNWSTAESSHERTFCTFHDGRRGDWPLSLPPHTRAPARRFVAQGCYRAASLVLRRRWWRPSISGGVLCETRRCVGLAVKLCQFELTQGMQVRCRRWLRVSAYSLVQTDFSRIALLCPAVPFCEFVFSKSDPSKAYRIAHIDSNASGLLGSPQ